MSQIENEIKYFSFVFSIVLNFFNNKCSTESTSQPQSFLVKTLIKSKAHIILDDRSAKDSMFHWESSASDSTSLNNIDVTEKKIEQAKISENYNLVFL